MSMNSLLESSNGKVFIGIIVVSWFWLFLLIALVEPSMAGWKMRVGTIGVLFNALGLGFYFGSIVVAKAYPDTETLLGFSISVSFGLLATFITTPLFVIILKAL